ncbi:hypothetical protein CEXT_625251 [Caerostris extrusa]|uniref:Uncharacterized protein n=1 Tax=Caerostris extrusa TaxID=172846 RepID=A0AAV4NGB6_CAEEX|nr:hypothetical protein CEXT_625251 [Caerostris extrusa]
MTSILTKGLVEFLEYIRYEPNDEKHNMKLVTQTRKESKEKLYWMSSKWSIIFLLFFNTEICSVYVKDFGGSALISCESCRNRIPQWLHKPQTIEPLCSGTSGTKNSWESSSNM